MSDSLHAHLYVYALQMLRLCIWLFLLVILFLPLERLFALHPSRIFRKDVAADLFYYFLSSLTPAVVLTAPMSALALLVHSTMPAAYLSWVGSLPLVVKVLAALVIGEFGFYWGHRWSHEIPYLWGFHAVHHSAEHMDFLVNTRAHPVDLVFTRLCGMIPLYVLGLAAPGSSGGNMLPVLVILVGTVWGFFIHSNIRWRLGPLEHLIATPAFHHWHHTNDRPQLYNKNYASMLPFLDRAFGTLHLPRNEHPQKYGIDQKLQPGVLGQLLDPFHRKPGEGPTNPQ